MTDWQERASKLICIAIYTAMAYVGMKYVLPAIFPLCVALLVAWTVYRISLKISKITGISRGICAFFIVTLLLVAIGAAVFFIARQLISEAMRMARELSAYGLPSVRTALEELERIPALYRFAQESEVLADSIAPIASKALNALASKLVEMLGSAIRATPSALIGGIMTVLFIYYASIDFESIISGARSYLPSWVKNKLSNLKQALGRVVKGYIRAYAVIFVLTFAQLLVGLLIICPSYALLGALIIASIDILPVFGAGLVLIPWGVASLISGDWFIGVGLLVLYLTVTVVRQIAEPRILGESMGVPPLLTLCALFVGYRLLGFAGFLFAPLVVLIIFGRVSE